MKAWHGVLAAWLIGFGAGSAGMAHAQSPSLDVLHWWTSASERRAADQLSALLVPAGVQGPGFLMLPNFKAIMRYNPAEAYALAIGHLADRLRGAGPFAQAWPRYERVLTRAERLELQQLLERHGFEVGEPDGRLGLKTRDALRDFQRRIGHVPDGFASADVLERLRRR